MLNSSTCKFWISWSKFSFSCILLKIEEYLNDCITTIEDVRAGACIIAYKLSILFAGHLDVMDNL